MRRHACADAVAIDLFGPNIGQERIAIKWTNQLKIQGPAARTHEIRLKPRWKPLPTHPSGEPVGSE